MFTNSRGKRRRFFSGVSWRVRAGVFSFGLGQFERVPSLRSRKTEERRAPGRQWAWTDDRGNTRLTTNQTKASKTLMELKYSGLMFP